MVDTYPQMDAYTHYRQFSKCSKNHKQVPVTCISDPKFLFCAQTSTLQYFAFVPESSKELSPTHTLMMSKITNFSKLQSTDTSLNKRTITEKCFLKNQKLVYIYNGLVYLTEP